MGAPESDKSPARWISEDLDVSDADAFVEAVAERLLADGVPVGRFAILLRSQHPTLMGRTFLWRKGEGVTLTTVPEQTRAEERFLSSAVYAVFERGETIRRRLCDGEGIEEFGLLKELAEEGATDYLTYPIPFIGGERQAVTWTCFEPGGFSEADIAVLLSLQAPIARMAEICTLRHTMESLLNTYVGPGAGARILAGRHHLGDSDTIEAVVCFCDLRGSVRLAEQYGGERFLQELNAFYSLTAQPVQAAGGEILRFIGDAFLAIFPFNAFGGPAKACEAAMSGATLALARMEEANAARRAGGEPVFRCGFGLHVGSVLYGNIGTPDRLEFTVIGSAANETARIEGLSRDLDEPILVSERFAGLLDRDWRDLGEHALKNVTRPVRIYAPKRD